MNLKESKMKINRHKHEVSENLISSLERQFKGKYLFWATNVGSSNNDDNKPYYLFYSPNPDVELGHTNFFKAYLVDGVNVYVSKADPDSKYIGAIIDDTFHFSRYRHDFQTVGSGFIDGGQAYLRSDLDCEFEQFSLKELAKVVYGYE